MRGKCSFTLLLGVMSLFCSSEALNQLFTELCLILFGICEGGLLKVPPEHVGKLKNHLFDSMCVGKVRKI